MLKIFLILWYRSQVHGARHPFYLLRPTHHFVYLYRFYFYILIFEIYGFVFSFYLFKNVFFHFPLVSTSMCRFLYKTWWSRHSLFFFEKGISGGNVVRSVIPGLRDVPDLVPIYPILPPAVHTHL